MYFRRLGDLRNDKDKTQRDIAEYLHMNLEVLLTLLDQQHGEGADHYG